MKEQDKVKCINIDPFKNNTIAPELVLDKEYEVKRIFTCNCGEEHFNVGLELNINYVECYKCRETLPTGTHWCHSSRFVIN